MNWLPILQGLVAAVAYGGVLLVALRVTRLSPTLIVLATGAIVYVAAALVFVLLGQIVGLWAYSTTYWFLVLCFLMAFGAIYKSLSLRMLLRLLDDPGRTASVRALAEDYVLGESFADRLRVATESGLVSATGVGYQLTSRGTSLARRVRTVQLWFGIEKSG
jgi:hypothetical protein